MRIVATSTSGSQQSQRKGKLPLQEYLPAKLQNVARQLSRFMGRQYAQEFGISMAELRVIVCIADLNSCSSGEICAATAMDKPMVHRAVTRLVALGHIVARISSEDRRTNVLRLSRSGKALYDRVVAMALDQDALLLDDLSLEERRSLLRILNKLQRKIDVLSEGRQQDAD